MIVYNFWKGRSDSSPREFILTKKVCQKFLFLLLNKTQLLITGLFLSRKVTNNCLWLILTMLFTLHIQHLCVQIVSVSVLFSAYGYIINRILICFLYICDFSTHFPHTRIYSFQSIIYAHVVENGHSLVHKNWKF